MLNKRRTLAWRRCAWRVPGSSSALGANAADKMKLTLNFLAQPAQAGFFLAKEKGYYKDEGIDLTIVQGHGSSTRPRSRPPATTTSVS